MEGRATLSKRVLPLLRQLPEGVFRELMLQSLAERTGLELESLRRLDVAPGGAPRDGAPSGHSGHSELEPPPIDAVPAAADDDHAAPAQRPPPARSTRHATLTQAAIALLLHRPGVAALADPRELAQLTGPEGALLREILELLHKRPESTTGMLLGHWHGTQEGALLARLAGQERLIPAEAIEQQFGDILRRLTAVPLRERIVEEIQALKTRDYTQLTAEDKTRLRELIRALRDLDARSAARQ